MNRPFFSVPVTADTVDDVRRAIEWPHSLDLCIVTPSLEAMAAAYGATPRDCRTAPGQPAETGHVDSRTGLPIAVTVEADRPRLIERRNLRLYGVGP